MNVRQLIDALRLMEPDAELVFAVDGPTGQPAAAYSVHGANMTRAVTGRTKDGAPFVAWTSGPGSMPMAVIGGAPLSLS